MLLGIVDAALTRLLSLCVQVTYVTFTFSLLLEGFALKGKMSKHFKKY